MLIAILLIGLASLAFSQAIIAKVPTWNEQSKLTASDDAAGDMFGVSVAISGDTMVAGAPNDNDAGSDSGSAYVFVRSGTSWSQQAKLTASDGAADDMFGNSVAISGDTVVVGAPYDNDGGSDSGSAYIFVRTGSTWTEQTKLTASDAVAGDMFGASVAIGGNTTVVGAYGDDDAGSLSGSAYVFVRSGSIWSQQDKLTASDAAGFDYFGSSVAISGDTAIVGAYSDDDAGAGSGSAYVFVRNVSTWTQQDKLTASDAAIGDEFGTSVAISGDTVAVGAPNDNDGGSDSGSAYVFVRSDSIWTQQTKLTASDDAADDMFGVSVAISGDSVVIGAYGNDDAGSLSGSAYVFMRSSNSWSQQAKLTASDSAAGDMFGNSVAISSNTGVVGASLDNDAGDDSGSAYIYVTRPAADFSATTVSGDEPLTVNFTDTSTSYDGIVSWSWNFGDGQTSTTPSPTHEYAQDGTYTVSLTVTEADNDSDIETKTNYITVLEAGPTAKFSATPLSGNEPLTVNFTDTSTSADGIDSWLWDFGDGHTSTEQSPAHKYAQNGTYTVSLTVTEADSNSDTKTRTSYITVLEAGPISDFTATPSSGNKPLTVNFTDASISADGIFSWAWNFGDGQTSTEQSPQHEYTQDGTYTVSLTVTEADSNSNTKTRTGYITVSDTGPSADFSTSPVSGYAPLTVNFTDTSTSVDSIVSWEWDFDDDGTIDSRDQNPEYEYTQDGYYTISLTVTEADGDFDTETSSIVVKESSDNGTPLWVWLVSIFGGLGVLVAIIGVVIIIIRRRRPISSN